MTDYLVKLAASEEERAGAFELRRRIFCAEQGLFAADDHDAIDAHALSIVALARLPGGSGPVVGTVRIHAAAEPGVWWGSRLGVEPAHRRVGSLGAALIRFAVSTAHARGCARFLAHVQSQNAALFHRLHWRSLDEVTLHGRPHHLMEAELAFYPPEPAGELGKQAA